MLSEDDPHYQPLMSKAQTVRFLDRARAVARTYPFGGFDAYGGCWRKAQDIFALAIEKVRESDA